MLVEFLKDYAVKKKGETLDVESQLAARLISKKIAKKYKKPVKRATKNAE